MALSSDLISQFVKATRDTTKQQTETTVQGTAVLYKGRMHARIDGSDLLTPINQTTDIKETTKIEEGDRVTILIKNHTATATGNISSPSARTDDLKNTDKKAEEASKDISKFQIIMAAEVNTTDLEAITATIESLKAKTASFESMTAITADIQKLQAKYAELEYVDADTVKALNADIDSIKARIAEISDLTVEDLDAMNADINQLKAYNAEFTYVSADVLEALKANIKELEVKKLTAEQADLKYANIDFANINMESVKKLFSESGIIKDLVVSEGKITGELVGVTIKGDLIEGNTVKADKLVVKGSDGLYYKLNIEGGATTSEQVTEEDLQNGLSGSIIVAKSITAEKVAVDDLVAFDATIGGFNITKDSIYSGVKESVDNTTRGIYLDKTGQVAFGDANNYLKFYKDTEGKWKLEIASNSLIMSSRKTTVEDALSKVEATAIVKQEEQFYKSTSHVSLVGGDWSTEQPVWEEGYYIWRRTAVTYGNGDSEYLPSSTGVCITGNTGAQGLQGLQGPQGEQGIQGPKGDPGQNSYFHIKYSDVANPETSSQITETPSKYIGTYVDNNETDSDDPSKYTWQQLEGSQGPQGEQGIPGTNGTDGKTSYLHIAYANSADGKTGFSVSDSANKLYIGQYTDFVENDSTDPEKYSWTKIKGEDGQQGLQGLQGPQGEQGIQGPQGDPGTDGKTSYFHIKYSSVENPTSSSQMTETPSEYIGTYVDFTEADSTDPSKYTWSRFEGLQGEQGEKGIPGQNGIDGKTSYLHIKYSNDGGTTFTANNGETPGDYIGQYTDFTEADSTNVGSYTWSKIKGEQGIQGLQGLQGEKGEQGIQGPKGDTGATGEQGPKGDPGTDGKTSYFHIKYSTVANPTTSSQMTETPSTYIGTYVDFTEADSTDPSKYTWSRFEGLQGTTGEQGIPGTNGIDGKTSYLHIKYSNVANPTSSSQINETGGDYIGQYIDFAEADSTDPSKYTWTKIKGEQGEKGATGATGTGYTVLLSNESHTFPGSTSAAIASSESTNIIAYKNTSQVAANVTKIGSTTVNGNVSGVATGIAGLTATVENNGTTTCKITFHATTSLTTASGSIAIIITVDGKTFTKNFSFSLSLKGGTGTAAKAVDIVASSQVFKSTDGGKIFSPDTITLTPVFQGGVTYSKWKYSTDGGVNWIDVNSGSHGLTVSNSVLTIAKSSDLYTDEVTSVSFKCISSDSAYFDVVTVVKLYDVMDLEVGGRNLLSDTRDFGFTDTTGVALNANPNAVLNNEIYEQCAVRYYSGTLSGNTSNSVIVEYKTLTPRYGQSYTLSFWAKGIGNFRTYFYGGSGYVDVESFVASDGTTGTTHDGSKAWTLTEDWKRYWITYTLKSSGDVDAEKYVLIRHDGNLCSDLTISVAGLKLELGNIATDWTPAPEDTELQITNAVSRINDIVSDSKLTPNEKTIAKKEWLVIEDEYPNYIEQAVAYGVITTEYTDAYNALDSYLNSEENGVLFDMTVTTDINSGVFTNHFKNYYNCKVKLSNYISKYSGLSGRNLIIGSGTMGDDYDVCTNDPIIVEDGCNGQKAVKTTKAWSGYYIELQEIANRNDIDTGDTVTVSIYVSTDSENEVNNHLYLFRGQNENDTTRDFETVTLNKGTWSRLAHTFTINDASVLSNKMRFECNVDTGYGLLWSCPKVEIGNKLTDWSPAPEDLDKTLSEAVKLIKKNESAILSLSERDFAVEFKGITDRLKNVEDGLKSYDLEVTNWMRFDKDGYLRIGSTPVAGEPSYEIQITKQKIQFLKDDNPIAYIDNEELYITKTTVMDNMKIGHFAWKIHGDGNLGLVYE